MSFPTAVYPVRLLDELRSRLRQRSTPDSRIPKFIFLCGQKPEDQIRTNRDHIMRVLRGFQDVRVVLAEELWNRADVDLLSFEQFMAHISDCVVLFLESYGTAAELGSFTAVDGLIPKLLVYEDKKYRTANSFINNGPISKITTGTEPGVVIYGNIESVLESPELWHRLNSFAGRQKKCQVNQDPHHVFYASYCIEVLDLVGILGPVHRSSIVALYKHVKGFESFEFDVKRIGPGFAVDFLKECGLLLEDGRGFISVNRLLVQRNLLLFNLNSMEHDRFRANFLARRFRYGEGHETIDLLRRRAD